MNRVLAIISRAVGLLMAVLIRIVYLSIISISEKPERYRDTLDSGLFKRFEGKFHGKCVKWFSIVKANTLRSTNSMVRGSTNRNDSARQGTSFF